MVLRRRDIRRLAMQALYQIDMARLNGPRPRTEILDRLDADHDPLEVREAGTDLALQAWAGHAAADEAIASLATDWPTHRQPPVDRAILRLAWHEMTSGCVPVKVAINEAVELAKSYCSEQSPAFINGVLDKLAKALSEPPLNSAAPDPDTS